MKAGISWLLPEDPTCTYNSAESYLETTSRSCIRSAMFWAKFITKRPRASWNQLTSTWRPFVHKICWVIPGNDIKVVHEVGHVVRYLTTIGVPNLLLRDHVQAGISWLLPEDHVYHKILLSHTWRRHQSRAWGRQCELKSDTYRYLKTIGAPNLLLRGHMQAGISWFLHLYIKFCWVIPGDDIKVVHEVGHVLGQVPLPSVHINFCWVIPGEEISWLLPEDHVYIKIQLSHTWRRH